MRRQRLRRSNTERPRIDLALVPVNGPVRCNSDRRNDDPGTRTPMVPVPAVNADDTVGRAETITVNGPGQNSVKSPCVQDGTDSANESRRLRSAISTRRGFPGGRPFIDATRSSA